MAVRGISAGRRRALDGRPDGRDASVAAASCEEDECAELDDSRGSW